MKKLAVGMLLALVVSIVACVGGGSDDAANAQVKGTCGPRLECPTGQTCFDLSRTGDDYQCVEGDACTAAGCAPRSCDYLEINPPRIACR